MSLRKTRIKKQSLPTVLLTLSLLVSTALAVELRCQFRMSAWWPGPPFYECEDTESSINSLDEANVTNVIGAHSPSGGRSNDDVKSFYAYRMVMRVFPRGLERFFKNLEIIAIVNEKLQQIRQNDLRPFYKLRILYLDSNLIETLDRELFKFNPNIEAINFSNNRIRYVDVSVFKSLQSLRSLWFENNACHSSKVTSDSIGVRKLIDEVRERCFVDNILTNLQRFQEVELTSLRMQLERARLENENLKVQINNMRVEHTKVTMQATQLRSDVDRCSSEQNQLRAELKTCTEDLKNLTLRGFCHAKDGPSTTDKSVHVV